ncbi:MAG: glycerol-3-phosphate O-acyltransferase / dihydroxyacetone phosphate acyltransferase [Acidimicrobiaceae bacterium]|jgi:1-acyl-sn-glycerol-3-phosphate acyltransferase
MRALGALLIHVFFRRVEVDAAEHLPAKRPVLVVANHTNGLVDGLLLIAKLDRYPRFLGKATLFKVLPLAPLLKLAGVVPVYRAKDGEGTERNDLTFRTSRALLAAGGVVAIFPEGISHDEMALQPLRTGAARIALGAAFDEGAAELAVVPVGLAYDNKARFRSRALVTLGPPIDIARWRDDYETEPREAARALTEEIAEALRKVGPDYESVESAATFAEIADVGLHTLQDRETVARRLAHAPDGSLTPLREAYATYARDLALLGVRDADVGTSMTPARYRWVMAWGTVKVLALLPLAVFGAIVHGLPYQVVKQLAKTPKNEGVKSTVKILGCALLFLIEWLVLAYLAARAWGWPAGLGGFALCPIAGYTTVRFAERIGAGGGLRRGYRRLRARQGTLDSVLANRDRVVVLTRELVAKT